MVKHIGILSPYVSSKVKREQGKGSHSYHVHNESLRHICIYNIYDANGDIPIPIEVIIIHFAKIIVIKIYFSLIADIMLPKFRKQVILVLAVCKRDHREIPQIFINSPTEN